MTDNMRIWDALSKTDPKHTKPFKRAGGFSGTATKPIWLLKRLTEFFGPCGSGWGMDKPEFQIVNAGDEILVFCTVGLWYRDGDEMPGRVFGVGGDKVTAKRQSGSFNNDEAFKASYTDALSNAMKQIGVAADIHMGLFEDQKYLREVSEEFGASSAPRALPAAVQRQDRVGQVAEATKDGLVTKNWTVKATSDETFATGIFDLLDAAKTPDEIADILRQNQERIAGCRESLRKDIEAAADKLLRWFETEAAKGKAA